jgi:tetratricopeptide (TPR) repeat protein
LENAEQAKSYFFSGLDALAEGRLEVAEVAFTESLRLVPDRTSVLTNLAAVQIRLLKYQAALCHAEKAISLDTKNFEGLLNAGVANYRLKRNHQAVDYFDKAIQIDGANADAWCNRGVSKKELGYFEERNQTSRWL